MRKITTTVLILALICAFVPAAAAQEIEIHPENAQFYIVATLPGGSRVENSMTDGYFSLTEIEYITVGRPSVVITTAADELYIGRSLSDLSKEDVNLIIATITVEMSEPVVEVGATPDGYEYIVVNESTATNDTCDTVMLINGYFIMVHVFYADFSELTEADMEIGPAIVETFRFVSNINS
ncbi:MAG: hypothetical protein JW811_08435 [Clostridiales bacterium]|nr:hypothetical protein [Clostridiales bacterium]